MSTHVLVQLQLSNYNRDGFFILTADSNWQIFVLKAVQMIKINPTIKIDVIVPLDGDCLESPYVLLREHGLEQHVKLISVPIAPNAPRTRFDFPWRTVSQALGELTKYTHVYVNDPVMLSHYRAMFHLAKAKPKFILQTHFLDSPLASVVDPELSYWYRTVEACDKSDVFLWHCNSMETVFKQALMTEFQPHVVQRLMAKSDVWKDGYSITEIRKPVNHANVRFDTKLLDGKRVVWVPNRVGGLGKSFDYTNNGKFLFEVVPQVWERRQDFVVVAGNPNQKVTNDEIAERCPAYVKLLPGSVNRDEYRWLSARADIVVGLYTNDTNGGLASLESIEFKAVPLFPDIYEYGVYFDAVGWPKELRIDPGLSDAADVMCRLLDCYESDDVKKLTKQMQSFVRGYASYEHTTFEMMRKLGLT